MAYDGLVATALSANGHGKKRESLGPGRLHSSARRKVYGEKKLRQGLQCLSQRASRLIMDDRLRGEEVGGTWSSSA